MKIIAIEGLDKAGKHTQVKLLAEYLESLGYNVATSSFPRYDTPTGELIGKWMRKEWDVDQRTIEFILAADRQAQQTWFKQLESQEVDFLILDRYLFSQLAYGISSGSSYSWIHMMHRYMRKPDLEIVIDIRPIESLSRRGKHNNGKNDRYEEDIRLLEGARTIFTQAGPAIIINGMQTIDDVHFNILSEVGHLINN